MVAELEHMQGTDPFPEARPGRHRPVSHRQVGPPGHNRTEWVR